MTADRPTVVPFGDSAVLIVLGSGIDDRVSARVHGLARRLADRLPGLPGFGSPVPAHSSVLVPVDPLEPGVAVATAVLADLVAEVDEAPDEPPADGPLVELPTRYGGRDGPDLDEVAALHGLTAGAVVELHASVEYRVRFLGFAPGFAYLARVPHEIATPRLATPRQRVPGGSVAIAGEQSAVYPFDSPGGWRLIGRTEVPVWDVAANPPARLLPGHRVRFVPLRR